jgi:hypothetical protein
VTVGAAARRAPRRRAGTIVALVLVALALIVGCSADTDPSAARPGQRPRTGGPADDTGSTTGTIPTGTVPVEGRPTQLDPSGGLLVGTPVYDGDFADPFVLIDAGTNYVYATNTDDANLPVIVSAGGNEGTYYGDAFPQLPAWTTPGFVWAPAVYAHADGYIAYYTTADTASKRQCVSRAVAPSPVGPFVDDSTGPLVCQSDLGGTIDPSIVTDVDGESWLLFKNDGNCCNITTSLWSQKLSPDGLDVVGEPTKLIDADQPWEGNLIEAPSMVIAGGTSYLFYSANAWDTANYAVGYARCESITGPCTKAEGPWMTSTAFAKGPGGQEFFAKDGFVWMVYHGWERGQIGYPQGQRRLYLDIVQVTDGTPVRVGEETARLAIGLAIGAAVVVIAGLVAVVVVRRRRRRSRTVDAATSQHG